MLHLWRWINVSSPLALMTSAIVVVGVSGCRNIGVLQHRSYAPSTVLEPAPAAPVPLVPYDEKPDAKQPILIPVPQSAQTVPPPEEDDIPSSIAKSATPERRKLDDVPPVPMDVDVFAEPTEVQPKVTKVEPKPVEAEPKVVDVAPKPVAADTEPTAPEIKVQIPASKPVVTTAPTVVTTDEPEPVFKPTTVPAPVTEPVTATPTVTADELEEFAPPVKSPEPKPPVPAKAKVITAPAEVPPLPEAVQPNDPDEDVVPMPALKAPPLPVSTNSADEATSEEPSKVEQPAKEVKPAPTFEPAEPDALKNLDADPFEAVDVFSPESGTPEPKTTSANSGKLNSPFPSIVPGPTAAKTERPFSVKLPEPEPVPVPQAPTRETKPVEAKPAPRIIGPLPEKASQQSSSQPATNRTTSTDVAEFDATVDNIVVADDGSIYVSHRTAISKISPSGRTEIWSSTGAPRGHIIIADGSHVVCDASQRAVLKLDAEGNLVEKLAVKSDGYFLRAPHDVTSDSEGGLYFTDPGYARIRNPIGQIHYVARNGKVTVVAQKLAFPEGIAVSPDGMKLYVIESQKNQLLAFDIVSAGKVGSKFVLATLSNEFNRNGEGSASGLAVDEQGRIYVAHRDANRVEVLDADGRAVTTYSCGTMSVSTVALSRGSRPQILTGGGRGFEVARGAVQTVDLSTLR